MKNAWCLVNEGGLFEKRPFILWHKSPERINSPEGWGKEFQKEKSVLLRHQQGGG